MRQIPLTMLHPCYTMSLQIRCYRPELVQMNTRTHSCLLIQSLHVYETLIYYPIASILEIPWVHFIEDCIEVAT